MEGNPNSLGRDKSIKIITKTIRKDFEAHDLFIIMI